MSAPTRIRATLRDGVTELRMLMSHPMENGLRKDAEGKLIPAHFITEVGVQRNGEIVLEADFGPSVSTNPYLAFSIAGGAPGDEIVVSWRDNLGGTRSDTIRVT
ncbi:thiosulfate oxidation carrier complex protein SoxZ [Aromatoleum evansii]|uniref:Thiosulfate oxidation carrier complex protein SoxZ n=1 Tax=Aromatoleum evansii TaxID=59406 RepID=A0ABZ1AJC8_AROEV|nr:thiosulfate oxidation carrier complex protein SoxZ [Aromatoleum evansii]NMG30416.1 thiosulfate oxidation carrier complex protein SoxZ [Aromatoleum evansii]WRL45126.1 thiosulfate oxidation carrier complex protein SoxZ [Aromatoleum evansii]